MRTDDRVAVRVAGRPARNDHAEDDEEEQDEDEEETDDEDDEPAKADGKKTFAARVGISRPKPKPRQKVLAEMDESDAGQSTSDYELPGMDLLLPGEAIQHDEHEKEVRRKAKVLEKTFADFGFNIRVVEIQTGPVIAQFEVELEAGLRLSRITGLADDLAIALRVPSVRIVAPLPGKNTVGIEVPNNERQLVHLREVMEEVDGRAQKMRIPIYLGKDVTGNPLVVDLTTLPHLLIAGRTGTGKSVCLNSIIVSMLMTRRPDEVRMLMVDPKMVELSPYKCLPHLMHPVVTDMRKAEAILGWAVEKMEERYHLLARAGVRHISVYNQLGEEELMERIRPEDDEERKQIPTHMPYIVLVADELADLMMTAAKEVEGHIIRLAQKSRAVGIHLVLATQKPTVDVITGLIKSNLPARIAFQVASRTDSRVVLGRDGRRQAAGQRRHAVPLARHQHADPRPGHVSERRRNLARHRRGGHHRAAVRQGTGAIEEHRDGRRRQAVQQPRRAVRGGHRHRDPRRARQRVAVAADPRHRLRPRCPADRLHGRRRHCRRLQRFPGPGNPHYAGTVGGNERSEVGRRRDGQAAAR